MRLIVAIVLGNLAIFCSARGDVSTKEAVEPTEIDAQIKAVENLLQEKDLITAQSLLTNIREQVPPSDPHAPHILLLAAEMELAFNHSAQAILLLNHWLGQYDDRNESAEVHLLLGKIYRDALAYDRAKENFYAAMNLAITDASKESTSDLNQLMSLTTAATWEIAETEYETKNWERSAELFQRFREQNPKSSLLCHTSLYRQADCYYQDGKVDQAIDFYAAGLESDAKHPFAPEALLRLVELNFDGNHLKNAKESLEKFVMLVDDLKPQEVDYWMGRCSQLLLQVSKKYPAIREDLLKVVSDYTSQSETVNFSQVSSSEGVEAMKEGDHSEWTDWQKKAKEKQSELEEKIGKLKSF